MTYLTYWIRTFYLLIWVGVFAQGPQFIDQYLNHLDGHVQELRIQDNLLKKMMGEQDLKLLALKLKESDGLYATKQSDFILQLVERKENFETAIQSLKGSTTWNLPFYFVRYFDSTIGQETMNGFNFGLPATMNGLFYALSGGCLGWMSWFTLASIFRRKKTQMPQEVEL